MNTLLSERQRSFIWNVMFAIGSVAALWSLWILLRGAWLFWQEGAFVWDSAIYWALGHAIRNGLRLYSDIFDNKPPGVYLLSAASFSLFGSPQLGHALGVLSLLSMPAAAASYAWTIVKQKSRVLHCAVLLTALLASTYWAIFTAEKGGPWQTETFGALFATLYVWLLFSPFPRHRWVRIAGFTTALLFGMGFKEPFLFVFAAAALIAMKKPRDLIDTLVIPTGIALLIGTLILLVMGSLVPYLTLDLPSLISYRTAPFGPFWLRAFYLGKSVQNLFQISALAPLAVLGLLAALFIFRLSLSEQTGRFSKQSLKSIVTLLAALYLATFTVGLGGDFQSHHFVFYTPVFLAALFFVLRAIVHQWERRGILWITYSLLVLWALAGATIVAPAVPQHSPKNIAEVKQVAAGIDVVLDRCDIDRYLIVSDYRILPYAYTRHSPINHSLFLQIDNAIQYGQTFLDLSLERLSAAQVIVLPSGRFESLTPIGVDIVKYIQETFAQQPPPCAMPLPSIPDYALMFRVKPDPFNIRYQFDEESRSSR